MIFRVILIFLFVLVTVSLKSQNESDSLKTEFKSVDTIKIHLDSTKIIHKQQFIPKKAVYLSLLCPGLGQIYNKSYWKLPIVYGVLGYFFYKIVDNQRFYKEYQQAYFYRTDGNPETVDKFPTLSNEILRSERDNFRRDRDFNIMFSVLSYTLIAVEAYVDAHLKTYNISDNLALKCEPKLNFNSIGLSLALIIR